MSKIRVGIAFGGRSSERDISLRSGLQVYTNLPEDHYAKSALFIDEKARFWELGDTELALDTTSAVTKALDTSGKAPLPLDQLSERFDVIFPVMHGMYGEDGTIQGMFEMLGVRYVGSGVRASANAMHKITTKVIYKEAGLPIARDVVIEHDSVAPVGRIVAELGLPVVVKPMDEGSSVGITIAKTAEELEAGLTTAFTFSKQVLVEQYVNGLEITVGVFGTKNPVGLPVIEIVPKHEFFDLEAKYDPELTDEICPARIPDAIAKQAQEFAIRAHQALGCRTFSRTDMIIHHTDQLVLLETNTIPGMTSASLLPKSAKAHGWTFPEFLDQVVKDAISL